MKRFLLIIGAILLCLALRAQSVTYTCRYWFDQNEVQTTTFSDGTWQAELDVGALADGLHTLHLHVMDTSMKWSAPQSYLFLKTTVTAPENFVYQYWFDEGQRQSSPIGNGIFLLDVATLDAGIHTLHVMLKGSDYSSPQSYIFLKPELTGFDADNWVYHCWFDEDFAHRQTDSLGIGNFLLDVVDLEEGLHTLNVFLQGNSLTATQSYMFMRVEMLETDSIDMSNLTYHCWFDQDYEHQQTDSLRDGNILLDVNGLEDGLHTMNMMLEGGTGTMTATQTYMFLKVAVDDPSLETQYRCWFDEDDENMQTGLLGSGIFQLEVSGLSNGLHAVHVHLDKGKYTSPQTYFFYKIPYGGNGLNKWEYCVNGLWSDRVTTNIVPAVDTLSIVSLLPVPTQPIRSSCFQFHPNGDTPEIFAKNEITLHFWTADDHFIDKSAFYVDEYVSETIEADSLERNTTVCIAAPRDNYIKWYKLPLQYGDSVAFRTDKACTMQLFSPSGEEVYAATAGEALVLGGCHAFEDGDYYLAVHDVTGSGEEVCLTNVFVHKYAILAYDVHLVGNGGCSTITFQGNGFNSLLDAYLVNQINDTIRNIHIDRENNMLMPVVWNFYEVNLEMYDAVFEFYDETIRINDAIQVEPPVDMALTATVSYPSQFLRNTVVTYNIDITNNGNMSAYGVPIYVYISTPTMDGISHLEFEGLGLSPLIDYFDLDSLSSSDIEDLNAWSAEMGEDHNFYKSLGIDEVTGDSIAIRTNYFFISVGARKTIKLKLKMKSNESPTVKVTIPHDPVPPKTFDPDSNIPRTCLVSYNCNGGVGCPEDQTVLKRTSITLAEAPTKEGYTFFGWGRGCSTFQPGSSYFVTNDITFTARWTPEDTGDTTHYCTVYYKCNGGVSGCPDPDTIVVEADTRIILPNAPIMPNCTFVGWNDGEYVYRARASYRITDDITFTAIWNCGDGGGNGSGNNGGGNNGGGNNGGGSNPYCCAKEQIECTLDAICSGLDLLSAIPSGWSLGLTFANCVCESLSLINRSVSMVVCEEDSWEDYWDSHNIVKHGTSIVGTITSCIKATNPTQKVKDILQHIENMSKLLDLLTNGIEPDCIQKWRRIKQDCPDGDTDGGESDAVNSLDPNDIHGYLSESSSHYMRQEIQNIHYEIEFENDTTLATAAAHTIIVRDTLDATKFDLSSLAAHSVTLGDKRLELNGEQNFARTLDMRPELYVIAQINQDYDPATGIVVWTIQSLDPMTMEPTDNPNQGVLPVNYYGDGIGFIDYSINLKQAFDDGTEVSNRAGIIFDQEAVIMTPTWTNIVDAVKPTSHIENAVVEADSLNFSFVSSDNRSGVWYHTLYYRNNSTEQEWQVRKPQIFGNTFMLPLDSLQTTEYLVMAVDSAGNVEEKEMVAEVIVEANVNGFPFFVSGYGESDGGWKLIASPVAGSIEATTVDNIFGATDYDLYYYDQSEASEWRNYKSEPFELENGHGYLYATKEGQTLVFRGNHNEADTYEVTLAYTQDNPNPSKRGWNLIGNPFTVPAYADRSYYTMNEDGTAIKPNAASSATAIPACNGVMVKAEATGESVTFSKTAPSAAANSGSLQITVAQANTGSASVQDKAIVSFNEGDELGKFNFNGNAVVYIPQGGKDYAIATVGRDAPGHVSTTEVPVNFKVTQNGSFTITVHPENVEMAYLHLIDHVTCADVDLLASPTYTFTAQPTDLASRFRLVFSVCGTDDGDDMIKEE